MRSNELRSNELAQQTEARVLEKLDRVLKLLGVMAVKDLSQTAQITMLSRIGFSPEYR